MNYLIDTDKLATFRTPWYFLGTKVGAFMKLVVSGIKSINDKSVAFAQNKDYSVLINSQVIVLNKYLNQKFSTTGIYIDGNVGRLPRQYIFYKEEVIIDNFTFYPEEGSGNPYLFNIEEFRLGLDFKVMIPSAYNGVINESQLKSEIERFIFYGKNYTISYY